MALVALGVSGGIGAYKAIEVARGLQHHEQLVVGVDLELGTLMADERVLDCEVV